MADYKEFSRQIKEKYPQYRNIEDEKLARAMIKKYPQYANSVSFDTQNAPKQPERPKSFLQGLDLTPSGLLKRGLAAGISAPARMLMYGENYKDAYDTARRLQEESTASKIASAVTDIGSTFLIPETAVFKASGALKTAGNLNKLKKFAGEAGNRVLTNTARFGTLGGLQGLRDEGLKGILTGALKEAALANAAEGAFALGGQIIRPFANKYVLGTAIGGIEPETLKQAVKPGSRVLDLNTKEKLAAFADRTTNRVRDTYKNILSQKGQAVGEAKENLRKLDNRIPADDLTNEVKAVFDKYQGERLNDARDLAGNIENEILQIIERAKPEITNINTADIPQFTGDKTLYNKQLKDLYKQNIQGKTVQHPAIGDINFYGNGLKKTIDEAGNDFEQLSLLPQIDDITKNARYETLQPAYKMRSDGITDFDILSGRANINGHPVDTQIKIGKDARILI